MNLTLLFQAVRQASILCREVQQHHIVENQKIGQEPVTIADYGSQAIICEALSRHFPNDPVMAEESGTQFVELVAPEQRRQVAQLISTVLGRSVTEAEVQRWLDHGKDAEGERTWVIDPIDGTKGFLALRHYVIAVGILEGSTPTGAVMGCPAYPGYDRGAMMYALDGATYIQPMFDDKAARRVQVSTATDAASVRVLESVEKSHAGHEQMARVRQLAGLGDASLERVDSQEKYARIAAGDGELYLRLPRMQSNRPHSTWDHAAGVALLTSAGGKVTDVDGSPLDFTHGRTLARNYGMIVSNGHIHDQVLDAVKHVLAEDGS